MKNKLLEKIQKDNIEMFDFFKKLLQELYATLELTIDNIIWDEKITDIIRNNNGYTFFEDFSFLKDTNIKFFCVLIYFKNKTIVSLKFNQTEFYIDGIVIPTNINNLKIHHSQELSCIFSNDTKNSEISFYNTIIDNDLIEIAQLNCDLDISGLVNFNMTPFLINKKDGIDLLKNYTSE